MNIYMTADLHGHLPEVPNDADVLLIAGDICPDFGIDFSRGRKHIDYAAMQSAWLADEFAEWLSHVRCAGAEVVACWGNHDYVGERPGLVPKLPWTLLQDSEADVQGLRVYGTPWVPNLPRWAFYGSSQALQARAELIPEGIDVLMTHGPPYGRGDLVPYNQKYAEKYGTPLEGEHVGDGALNVAIERVNPRLVICGHIHEARGAYTWAGVPVLNVAAVDETYALRQPWWERAEHL